MQTCLAPCCHLTLIFAEKPIFPFCLQSSHLLCLSQCMFFGCELRTQAREHTHVLAHWPHCSETPGLSIQEDAVFPRSVGTGSMQSRGQPGQPGQLARTGEQGSVRRCHHLMPLTSRAQTVSSASLSPHRAQEAPDDNVGLGLGLNLSIWAAEGKQLLFLKKYLGALQSVNTEVTNALRVCSSPADIAQMFCYSLIISSPTANTPQITSSSRGDKLLPCQLGSQR